MLDQAVGEDEVGLLDLRSTFGVKRVALDHHHRWVALVGLVKCDHSHVPGLDRHAADHRCPRGPTRALTRGREVSLHEFQRHALSRPATDRSLFTSRPRMPRRCHYAYLRFQAPAPIRTSDGCRCDPVITSTALSAAVGSCTENRRHAHHRTATARWRRSPPTTGRIPAVYRFRRATCWTVRSMILMSSHKDQLLAYGSSISTISVDGTRDRCSCHGPVMPGDRRWRLRSSPRICPSSSATSGRGPTRSISPLRTFRSCGSSSSDNTRRKHPRA